jgi:methionine-rich copper-binding protein CopC
LRHLHSFVLTLVLLGAALLALFQAHPTVLAHADYDHSEPAADAVLEQSPTEVRIWFTQELFRRQGASTVEVYGPDGARVDRDDATIDDDNRKLMSISLASTLANGLYTVRWQALSAEDGHEKQGEFTFTVGLTGVISTSGATVTSAAPTVTPEPQAAPPTAISAPTNQPSKLPCLGASAPLALALGALWIGRRTAGRRLN